LLSSEFSFHLSLLIVSFLDLGISQPLLSLLKHPLLSLFMTLLTVALPWGSQLLPFSRWSDFIEGDVTYLIERLSPFVVITRCLADRCCGNALTLLKVLHLLLQL
jgi:hypothetical protein